MHPSDDEQRGLVWELGLYFLGALACVGLLLNVDAVRQAVSKTLISQVEKSDGSDRKSGRRAAPSPEAAALSSSGATVELKSDRRGHFQADIEINGRRIEGLVDTGASLVVLTFEDAQRAGLYPRDQDYTMRTQTANGTARAAPVMLDRVEIGGIQVRNVQAAVAEPGRLHVTLLGMTFLSRLQKFEISAGRLILHD